MWSAKQVFVVFDGVVFVSSCLECRSLCWVVLARIFTFVSFYFGAAVERTHVWVTVARPSDTS